VWRSVADSTILNGDTITDFDPLSGDIMDLHLIDADGNAANGNQAFASVSAGIGIFSAPGQIQWYNDAGMTYILVNADSDATTEMVIGLVGTHTVDASWFVL
jgi:hypothetical protein